ncbi:flagellin [Comamonas sp. NyZ500]|uniref:flagellin N-terminal helical domain-containing protein n=1 Tax=Comamonas TaxID=283 RepID=UPI00057A21A7|nr:MULTISPECIES: flagellin [Comamonas]MBL5979235.1 flagellin [Comamonas sp. NyZ500]
MAAIINTNIQSLNAQRNLSKSQSQLATSMQRLSSGMRINSAKDDAAGLAISERMSTQVRGLTVAMRNANDGISLAQTAEGALSSVGNNLQRIRELAVQSRNATNSAEDRAALDAEVQQLKAEVTRIAEQTSFNGTKLLDGSFTNMAFQVGANQGETISISGIADANIDKLGNWTSASTDAAVTGAIPNGGYTPAVPTTTGPSGNFTTAAAGAPGETFKFEVGGVTVIDKPATAGNETVTASNIDTELNTAAVKNALAAAGVTVTGTATAGTLAFQKADGSALTTTLTNTYGTAGGFANASTFIGLANGTPAVAPSFPAIGAGEFTLKGVRADGSTGAVVDIEVPATATAGDRTMALMNAVNAKTQETGVTASVVGGKLSLTSKFGDFTVGTSLTPATKLGEQTGIAAGVSGAAAGGTAYAAGVAKTGFADLSVGDPTKADNAILAMDAALTAVNGARATLGAVQSRFESTIENLSVGTENLSASRSRIMDADFAAETANLSRTQILQQAGTAMVAQANQLPQQVLKLLQG